jgi:hypothetical protein
MEMTWYLFLFFIVLPFIIALGGYVLDRLDIHLKRKQLELEALEISNKERAKRLRD